MLLSSHPKITHPKLTTRVVPTAPTHPRKRESPVVPARGDKRPRSVSLPDREFRNQRSAGGSPAVLVRFCDLNACQPISGGVRGSLVKARS
jgi:hypothetical protein